MEFQLQWPMYVQKVEAIHGTTLTTDFKLTLLTESLDNSSKAHLLRLQEDAQRGTSGPVVYEDFWNWLVRTYGQNSQDSLRTRLRNLKPVHEGKLTWTAWLEYANKFRLILGRLESPLDASELWDLVLKQIPERMRFSLVRESKKKDERNPVVKLCGLQGLPQTTVLQIVSSIVKEERDVAKTVVERKWAEYHLHLPRVEIM